MTNEPETKSQKKRRQIMDGASKIFTQGGYEGASMDQIAKEANVSKGTLYNYFPSKEALFVEYITDECRTMSQKTFTLDYDVPPRQALRQLGMGFLKMILCPHALNIHRIVVMEAPRFPTLGMALEEAGPKIGISALSMYLQEQNRRGVFMIDDTIMAANQFIGLCYIRLHWEMLMGLRETVKEEEIAKIVEAALNVFFAAYGNAASKKNS